MPGNITLIEEYRRIHATSEWGGTSVKNLRFIRPLVHILTPRSVLDYGCGKSPLLDHLGLGEDVRKLRYDPALPEYSDPVREQVDLLLNFDVLEHIEKADLDEVIGHMASIARNAIIVVDTKPAALTLADGRNAHVSLHSRAWWCQRLSLHFPELYPITVKRSGRAAFRTWRLTRMEQLRFRLLRIAETCRYLARRLAGKKY